MIWRERDHYRWRTSFALFPRNIGDRWIWLQAWRWRYVRRQEIDGPDNPHAPPFLWPMWYEEHDVPGVQLDYPYCRVMPPPPMGLFFSRRWFRLRQKPRLVSSIPQLTAG